MADFVSRSKVEFELCGGNLPEKYKAFVRRVLNDKNLVPSADVVPVVHGEWKTIGANFDRLFCSSCGQAALPSVKTLAHFAITFKFCPLCGAKMDGEVTG